MNNVRQYVNISTVFVAVSVFRFYILELLLSCTARQSSVLHVYKPFSVVQYGMYKCDFNDILISSNQNYISRSSPYRAVNTLRLSYTNQSVNAV